MNLKYYSKFVVLEVVWNITCRAATAGPVDISEQVHMGVFIFIGSSLKSDT